MDDAGAALASSRLALHAVVEHVVSPARHAQTGRIGLRVIDGGVGTPTFHTASGPTEVALAVRGDEVVVAVSVAGQEVVTPLTTVGAAAAAVGVAPGAPADVYAPVTPLRPHEHLDVDVGAARQIFGFLALADQALRLLHQELVVEAPTEIQVWPEHFDVAFTAVEVNYGGSPGDEEHPDPYLYVGPWSVPEGDFWNEPFGASCPAGQVPTPAEGVAFLRQGHDLVAGTR